MIGIWECTVSAGISYGLYSYLEEHPKFINKPFGKFFTFMKFLTILGYGAVLIGDFIFRNL